MRERGEIEPKVARAKLRAYQDALAWLQVSRRSLSALGESLQSIDSEIERIADKIMHLKGVADGHVPPRKKPRFDETGAHQQQRRVHYVFLDESGIRNPQPQSKFDLFVVGAAIVESTYFQDVLKPAADALKRRFFGEEHRVVFHEPALRRHYDDFYFGGDTEAQSAFCSAYREFLGSAQFDCVAAVIDKRSLISIYGQSSVDDFLPNNYYALAYDFTLERVCNLLYHERGDAVGEIYPERIGKRQDAELQLEHARLVNEGTRFVSEKWFQNQFKPGLRFVRKGRHFGIELADVVARTAADHYIQGESAPCWNVLKPKLFCGHMDRVTDEVRWGNYKIFPTQAGEK
jgi:hypothetical protein